jgi:hypothetical protein
VRRPTAASVCRTARRSSAERPRLSFLDTAERLEGNRRRATLGQLIEAPADMAPTEGKPHLTAFGEQLVAGIAVDLRHAAETGEVGDRPCRLAVRRIDKG